MYTFRISRHLDMFLMMHAWYHQCGLDLFGAWMHDYPGALPMEIYSQPPPDFQQGCLERCIFHAKSITSLIVKVLKVEPDHFFRDAWFSICVLDSTRIQVIAMERQNLSGEKLANVVRLLKVNLCALTNTKKTLVLAEKSVIFTVKDVGKSVLIVSSTKCVVISYGKQDWGNWYLEIQTIQGLSNLSLLA
jgi:hypothetical protein